MWFCRAFRHLPDSGLGIPRREGRESMLQEEQKRHSKWWWLPGTLSAAASIIRLAYQLMRDHSL
ncbi:hypothetical protein B0I32_106326 [Nonomuraea fuscirosea]|uniref:Uncharacterized protein n=1 Tax=Nonomuraea fuscirosea TaxID=1291556 RepID=A0A2T0N2H7_9ACTN|nr:hypothetical protein B0I32_106326 [Nonomuraea fuscirosea]